MYAILDIETTGGQFNEEGITEIAIYKYDGHEIIDQFISLVNPEIPIQPFVVKLTGINNAMLRSAPKFYEIAKRIIEITQDCIIVAHNSSFDYRILRTEFRRLGYEFESRTICTVDLAKKLIPEQASYSLGKLVRSLGIPIADRHRASGDAMATLKLFKILLDKDLDKEIVKEFVKLEIEKGITPKLTQLVESLPSKTGIYYFHREDGKIIYIGSSKNLKKRVIQHFKGITNSAKKIQKEVFKISYEETGSELIALLKEIEEIKINKPIYNRMSRKNNFGWAIYVEKDSIGYFNLKIQKVDGRKKGILFYTTLQDAKNALYRITSDYHLCQKLTGLYETKSNCFLYTINECDGACLGKVSIENYNSRVQNFINDNSFDNKNWIIKDKGRTAYEHSAILIENGEYKGFAYFDLNFQINNITVLKKILISMNSNQQIQNSIQNYIRKNKATKIIKF